MPSTTSNYGWTYPISTDDLNAGATSIGSLATGADSSLKAEENARVSAVNTLTTAVNARPTSNKASINISYQSVSTNSSGDFTYSSTGRVIILKAWRAGYTASVVVGSKDDSNNFRAYAPVLGGMDPTPSWVLGMYVMEFPG